MHLLLCLINNYYDYDNACALWLSKLTLLSVIFSMHFIQRLVLVLILSVLFPISTVFVNDQETAQKILEADSASKLKGLLQNLVHQEDDDEKVWREKWRDIVKEKVSPSSSLSQTFHNYYSIISLTASNKSSGD